MTAVENEKFWREFIDMFRNLPEVWQTNNEKFKSKRLKDKAFHILLTKLREIQPRATDSTLKRKLNLLKDGYKRELIRLKQSQKIAKNPDEIYIPTLWFFDELSFLKEQNDEELSDISNDDIQEKPIDKNSKNEKVTPYIASNETCNTYNRKPIDNDEEGDEEEEGDSDCRIYDKHLCMDEAQVFSVTWATLYRKLEPDQQLYANKAIMDVLYQGQLCRLDETSIQNLQGSAFSMRQVSSHSLHKKNCSWKNSDYPSYSNKI